MNYEDTCTLNLKSYIFSRYTYFSNITDKTYSQQRYSTDLLLLANANDKASEYFSNSWPSSMLSAPYRDSVT